MSATTTSASGLHDESRSSSFSGFLGSVYFLMSSSLRPPVRADERNSHARSRIFVIALLVVLAVSALIVMYYANNRSLVLQTLKNPTLEQVEELLTIEGNKTGDVINVVCSCNDIRGAIDLWDIGYIDYVRWAPFSKQKCIRHVENAGYGNDSFAGTCAYLNWNMQEMMFYTQPSTDRFISLREFQFLLAASFSKACDDAIWKPYYNMFHSMRAIEVADQHPRKGVTTPNWLQTRFNISAMEHAVNKFWLDVWWSDETNTTAFCEDITRQELNKTKTYDRFWNFDFRRAWNSYFELCDIASCTYLATSTNAEVMFNSIALAGPVFAFCMMAANAAYLYIIHRQKKKEEKMSKKKGVSGGEMLRPNGVDEVVGQNSSSVHAGEQKQQASTEEIEELSRRLRKMEQLVDMLQKQQRGSTY